jgi:hypothetical protein
MVSLLFHRKKAILHLLRPLYFHLQKFIKLFQRFKFLDLTYLAIFVKILNESTPHTSHRSGPRGVVFFQLLEMISWTNNPWRSRNPGKGFPVFMSVSDVLHFVEIMMLLIMFRENSNKKD